MAATPRLTPLDEASPPLTLEQYCALSGRNRRTVLRWVADGAIETLGREEAWPHRLLIPYGELRKAATRAKWGIRRARRPKIEVSAKGNAIALRHQTTTDSRDYQP